MAIKYTNKTIYLKNRDRIIAILIGENGRIYEGDTHQDCFYNYCTDLGIKDIWGISDWDDTDEICEITHSLFKDETKKFYGFDVWSANDQKYLVSHFEENMKECENVIKEYNKDKKYILGTYKEFTSYIAHLVII